MAGLGIEAGIISLLIGPKLSDDFASTLSSQLGDAVGPAAEKASRSIADSLASGFESAGRKASVAITAPLVALGTKGVFDAQAVASGLAEVVSLTGLTGQAAADQISVLRGEVAELSSELGIAQNVLVSGLYQSISAGVPGENVFDFLAIAGQAAIAGVTDTSTAVDGLTTVINAFGLDIDDAQAVADSLFTAVKGGKTTFEELSKSLFNVAPAAAAAGVDFQTVNAAIATLTSAGVPTSVATTQIRAALVALQRPSEAIDEIFAELGFESRALAIESLGLQGALGAVAEAAQGDQGELQKLLGSVEAVSAANIIATTGAEKFRAELAAQETAAGSVAEAFDVIDNTRSFERLKVELQNLSISIGNVLLPVISEIASVATEFAARFGALSPETQKVIVTIGAFAAAVGPVLIIFAKLIKSVQIIIGVVKLLNLALLLNPFVLLAAAAVAAAFLIFKNWDTIKTFFVDLFNRVGEVAGELWEKLKSGFETVANVVTEIWSSISNAAATAFEAIAAVVESVVQTVQPFVDAFVEVFKFAFELIGLAVDIFLLPWRIAFEVAKIVAVEVFDVLAVAAKALFEVIEAVARPVFDFYVAAWNLIFEAAKIAFDAVATIVQTVFSKVTEIIDVAIGVVRSIFDPLATVFVEVFNGLLGAAETAFNFITGTASSLFEPLSTGAQTAVDIVLRLIESVRNAVAGVRDTIKNLPSSIAGGITSLPGRALSFLPGFADGGQPPTGVPVVVGERGPEIFVPRTSGTVISNEDVAGQFAGAENFNITINNPLAERASISIPNALRQAQYLRG